LLKHYEQVEMNTGLSKFLEPPRERGVCNDMHADNELYYINLHALKGG